MKAILFTILIFVSFTACRSDKVLVSEAKQSVTIAGKVLNNTEFPDDYLIKIIINDISHDDRRNYTTILEDDGTFKIDFINRIPQDLYLKYGKKLVTLFVHPGDSLYLEFDASDFINPPSDNTHYGSFKFSGDAAGINQELSDFLPKFYGQRDSRGYNNTVKSLSQNEFKDFTLKRREGEHLLLNTYLSANNSSDEFVAWATSYIDYGAGLELLRYWWYNSMLNTRKPVEPDLNDNYFDFLKYIPLDNKAATICSKYNDYLHEYFLIHWRQMEQKNSEVFTAKKKDWALRTSLASDYLTKNIAGFPLEVFLTRNFISLLEYGDSIEEYDKIYDIYKDNINDIQLLRSISDIYSEIRLHDSNSSSNGYTMDNRQSSVYNIEDILSKVISENPGRILYIDFWATWCGPCLMEMPASSELRTEYKDDKVTFVYFCVNSRKEDWEEKIRDYKIQGKNYLINDSQYGMLGDLFKITGIPHHVLINSVGEIANPKAPQAGTQEIRIELDKLLGK